jgi:mannose-6-phosphate isomerase-like protein (cupin superfamily)
MKACRTASVVASSPFVVAAIVGACHESPGPEIPELTTARPQATAASPVPMPTAPASDSLVAPAVPVDAGTANPPTVAFLEGTKKIEAPVCSRLYVVAVSGQVKVGPDSLAPGDILLAVHPEPVEVKVTGLAVQIVQEFSCSVLSRPPQEKAIVSSKSAPKLTWANGTMSAHLDVGANEATKKLSPDLYVGRLEGTAPVAEHEHPTSSETLVAIEANGTLTLDGKSAHLGARQIVQVPRGAKHAWKPEAGTKLVAIQIYEPAGPEQRFLGLAAAAKDAGAENVKR